jgi:hypothetical protein
VTANRRINVSTTSSTRPTERLRNTEKGPGYVVSTYLGPDTTVRLPQPRLRHDYDTILVTTITMTHPKPPRCVRPPPKWQQQQETTTTRDAYASRATTTPSRSQLETRDGGGSYFFLHLCHRCHVMSQHYDTAKPPLSLANVM